MTAACLVPYAQLPGSSFITFAIQLLSLPVLTMKLADGSLTFEYLPCCGSSCLHPHALVGAVHGRFLHAAGFVSFLCIDTRCTVVEPYVCVAWRVWLQRTPITICTL